MSDTSLPDTAAVCAGISAKSIFDAVVSTGDIVDLSHALDAGMPVYPYHAPYTLSLHRRHGDPHANRASPIPASRTRSW